MDVVFKNSKLSGILDVMSAKSISHRALICAALSDSMSIIQNVVLSDDVKRTIDCLINLGIDISIIENNEIIVKGKKELTIRNELNPHESGSTLRFLIPVALLTGEEVKFIGSKGLAKRPLDVYFDLFDKMGITYKRDKDGLSLPLVVKGKLKAGVYEIKGDVSSQFISGLLMALPLLEEDSKLILTSKLESKSYVDLTIKTMSDFNVDIINNNYSEFIIKGNQKYQARNYYIESDFSQAAFFIVSNILGSNILLKGLKKDSLQADKRILDIINKMGIEYMFDDTLIVNSKKAEGTIIDLSECPDLGPVISVLAALSNGKTEIINAKRLRLKESDRIKSIVTELKKLGADIKELEEGMVIIGKDFLDGGRVNSWNDHRIALALAIAAIKCKDDVIIENFECINKSYPKFLDDYKNLGGKYEKFE